jgi:RND family efflux transporter MFP subunit
MDKSRYMRPRLNGLRIHGPIRATLASMVAGFACLVQGCSEEQAEQPVRPVRVVTVGDVGVLTGRALPGQSEAFQEVDLSFRVSGPVIERPASRGDQVKQGDLLARIDPRDFEVRVRNLQADLATTKADLEFANIQYKRVSELLTRDAANQKEVDESKAKRDAAAGRTDSVQAQLEHAQDELSYTELRAPYDGVIAEAYVDAFTTVQQQQSILRFLDTSSVKFTVDIPEQSISNIPYVTEITVTFDAFPDTPVPGTIKEVAPQASSRTRTYPVTLVLDPPEGVTILPGMTGEARGRAVLPDDIQTAGLEIPATAILEGSDGKHYVWLINEGNTVAQHEVQVGPLTARGIRVNGLEPGKVIATAGVHYLKEGQLVRVEQDSAGGDVQ